MSTAFAGSASLATGSGFFSTGFEEAAFGSTFFSSEMAVVAAFFSSCLAGVTGFESIFLSSDFVGAIASFFSSTFAAYSGFLSAFLAGITFGSAFFSSGWALPG